MQTPKHQTKPTNTTNEQNKTTTKYQRKYTTIKAKATNKTNHKHQLTKHQANRKHPPNTNSQP